MEQLLTPQALASVGFPIIMCIWLVRIGRQTIIENTNSNKELTTAITKLTETIDKQSTRLDHITDGVKHLDDKISHLTELFVEHKTKLERADKQ